MQLEIDFTFNHLLKSNIPKLTLCCRKEIIYIFLWSLLLLKIQLRKSTTPKHTEHSITLKSSSFVKIFIDLKSNLFRVCKMHHQLSVRCCVWCVSMRSHTKLCSQWKLSRMILSMNVFGRRNTLSSVVINHR